MNSFIDWETNKFGIPYYFFYYYVSTRFTNDKNQASLYTDEVYTIRRKIWNFKEGYDQHQFIQNIVQLFQKTEQLDQDTIFFCIPASSIRSNQNRYGSFSHKLCSQLGLSNGFEHVYIKKEKEPKHLIHAYQEWQVEFDKDFFKHKKVIIFDDVVTKGHSMNYFIHSLEEHDAKVIACLSLAHTYYEKYGGELL